MSDTKKRGLGRGLGALLGGPRAASEVMVTAVSATPSPVATASAVARKYFSVGIEDLYPSPEQPRRIFDETKLRELADSMVVHGVITPLVIRPRPAGGYYLIAGERRWRAAQRAGIHELPVVVQDIVESVAFERALVENLQRADLGPLEEAAAYHRLVDELGYTQDRIAEQLGKDRSTIANMMRLLKLPAPVRQLVEDEQLSMGHARALLGLEDPTTIERLAHTIVDGDLSVRAAEQLVKQTRQPSTKPERPARPGKTAAVRDLEERLTRALGGPVVITEDAPGKAGRIEIRYMNLDHLEKLLDRLL
ncbi:MAG: ParB/RepB/Spo0J family partition protein [Proteobacteria bacterium]|nr:ParB/RepB/Spo0J family partition protein [Pseudomonadota bacterium]